MATKWVYTRVEMDCCRLQNCMQAVHKDELCLFHWKQQDTLPKRIEISSGEREWYAEQGRELNEAALLSRRMPPESAQA